MSSTSVTALIITFHNASVFSVLCLASLISVPIFLLFLRKTEKPAAFFLMTFLLAILLGSFLFDRVLHKKPVGIEVVQAG